MRIRIGRKKVALLALGCAVAGTGGALAYAAVPDSSGVIHGCYSDGTGSLRVVDTSAGCRHQETSLDWNQTGPTGPPGAGDGFFRERETGGPIRPAAPGQPVTVLTMDVPEGPTMLWATVQLVPQLGSTPPTDVACDLVSPDGSARRAYATVEQGARTELTIMNESSRPGSASIRCFAPSDGSIALDVPTTLAAIQLTNLEVQPPQ